MADLDAIRQRFPHIGLAVYAFDPGGDVTLEVYAEGQVWPFTGPTLASALARAFPTAEPEAPEPPTTPTTNVFD
jgi:hypothetical protein